MYFGIRGETEYIVGIQGVKTKYFQGAEHFFMDFGRSMQCLGSKGAQTP